MNKFVKYFSIISPLIIINLISTMIDGSLSGYFLLMSSFLLIIMPFILSIRYFLSNPNFRGLLTAEFFVLLYPLINFVLYFLLRSLINTSEHLAGEKALGFGLFILFVYIMAGLAFIINSIILFIKRR